jgi:hypothetical protein
MKAYYRRLLIALVPVFFSCGVNPNQGIVSSNAQTSSCGGFKQLAKTTAIKYSQDSATYCSAEKIIWTYSSSTALLGLLHTRIGANCASKLQMSVEEKNGVYVISQKDTNDPKMSADCDCVFDTYCDVPDIKGDSIILSYQNKSYGLNLSDLIDTIIIDTSGLYQCR